MTENIKSYKSEMVSKELVWILIACALLSLTQTALSHWQITPRVTDVWSAVVCGISAFWICDLVAVLFSACIFAKNSKEVAVIALFGVMAFLVAFVAYGSEVSLMTRIFESAKWLGLIGLLALAYQSLRERDLKNFLVAICFTLFVPISTGYLSATYVAHPLTMDLYTYSFDLSLVWRVAPYFYNLARHSWIVTMVTGLAYIGILGAYQILAALQVRFVDHAVVPALRIFLIAAILGFGCYFIFPVVGPAPFFGGSYPGSLPGLADFAPRAMLAGLAPRNGMPSLHFAWALLLLMNVPRRLRYAKALYALYCYLTFMATLSTGQHYFVDLIAALPFAALVQAIGLCLTTTNYSKFMGSMARSAIFFASFLILIAFNPWWLKSPVCAWLITGLLFVYFLVEINFLRNRIWLKCQISDSHLQACDLLRKGESAR